MYDYPAEIINIVDADTIDVLADKGTDDFKKMRIRFEGVNAPERGTVEGKKAKAWLTQMLTNSDGTLKNVYLVTIKDKKEKYGRYLGIFWLWGEDPINTLSINDRMVEAGHAQYKTY